MRESNFLTIHAGGSNNKWINTEMPKTIVIASTEDRMIDPNWDNNQGPTPKSRTNPKKTALTNISGNQALRSEEEGIIVLLTVKTR
jgi:predicted FMN-binding regulatory protein PaiB